MKRPKPFYSLVSKLVCALPILALSESLALSSMRQKISFSSFVMQNSSLLFC